VLEQKLSTKRNRKKRKEKRILKEKGTVFGVYIYLQRLFLRRPDKKERLKTKFFFYQIFIESHLRRRPEEEEMSIISVSVTHKHKQCNSKTN